MHWDRRLDAQLAAALMGIQAIKGVEVGDGFRTAARRGSAAHDEMERDADGVIHRRTGRAGGTEGGMSTGDVLRVRAAMKPISTVPRALDTVDTTGAEAAKAIHQRSDVCAVPAAGVVAEAMVALVLAAGLRREVRRRLGDRDGPQPRGIPRRRSPRRCARGDAATGTPCGRSSGRPGSARARSGGAWRGRSTSPWHDTDEAIEAAAGPVASPTCSSTTARPHFRDLERAEVLRALAEEAGVVSLGGGAPMDPEVQAALAGHTVVFLDVGIADAARRIGFDASRPLLDGQPRAPAGPR